MKNIDLEALKKATHALGEEQWYQDGTGTIWLAPSDPVTGPTDLSSAVLEVYLRTDEKDGDRQQFLALANPSAVLALIVRVERAEDFAMSFLNPERHGYSVSAHIRDEAREVLEIGRVETVLAGQLK